MAERRIGMIGLDTSHVEAFARILMDPDHPHHVPGGRIVAGWAGGSPDFELSISRVEGYTRLLQQEFGVEMLDTPEAVAERCDMVFIHAVDGRVHRELYERTAPYRRPTFIDKPFTTTPEDARAILDLASQSAAVMSCSALRYADPFTAALADDAHGPIVAVDVWGPLSFVEAMPAYCWYGVHAFELLVAAMGVGCRNVRVVRHDRMEVVACAWADGRAAVYRGMLAGGSGFGVVIHREKGVQCVDTTQTQRPYYASLIQTLMRCLPEGRSDIDPQQMYEVVRVTDLANRAREQDTPLS